ncbi:cadherin-like domain-containing protein, partial [Alphaproteobacteria bacterium]|nr:cadherin-like domain-containing protein [Alphaproteobacteria bacterium]
TDIDDDTLTPINDGDLSDDEPIATFTRTGTTRVMITADSGLYLIDDAAVAAEGFALNPGRTYIFDWSDATDHPVRLSETADGTHGGGVAYETGVTVDAAAGTTTIVVTDTTPTTLYVYCENHAAMGFDTPVEAYTVPAESYSVVGSTLTVDPQVFADLASDNAVEIAIAYKITDGDLANDDTYVIDNTATITITGLNTQPQIIDDKGTTDDVSDDDPNVADVTTPEDTPYVFTLDDFNYVDQDNDPMASVLITQGPLLGELTLNDVPITDPTRISRADIEAGLLKYTPPADENGNEYTAFSYAVSDGTVDSEVGTMTIHVTPVNDEPEADPIVETRTKLEAQFSVDLITDANATDIDDDTLTPINDGDLSDDEPIATFTRTGTTRVMITADSGLYLIDDAAVAAEGFALNPGRTYIFDWSDATDHPVRLSETADGTHGGGVAYETGVTVDAAAGTTTIVVTDTTPTTLYVYCENHAAMGFDTPVEAYTVPAESYSVVGSTLTVDPQVFADLASDNAVEIAIAYKITDGDLANDDTYVIDNTATITITGLNTQPQIIDDKGTTDDVSDDDPNVADVTTPEDTPYVFTLDDFNYVDQDNDPMASVLITQGPLLGELTLNDVPITDPTRISRADIEAGLLKYTPPADENGNEYTAFSYAVSDGTVDSEVGTMTIHVTPVNDAPTSQDRFVGIIGEMPVVFSGNEFAFDDVDDGDSLTHITLRSLPENGSLYLVPRDVNLPNNPRADGKAFAIDGMEMDAQWEIQSIDPQDGLDIPEEDLSRLVYLADTKASDLNYDEFTFTVNDGSEVEPVSLDSEEANRIVLGQLVAADKFYVIEEDAELDSRNSEGMGLNEEDSPIANLTFDFNNMPARGELNPLANGHFEFKPKKHFYDVDSQSPANVVEYTVTANGMTSEPGKITIIVVPTNDRPDVVGKIGNFQRPPGEEIKPISLIAENIFADIDRFDPRLNNFLRLTDKPNPVGSQTGASFDDIPDHGQLTYAIEGLPDGLTWNGVDKITGTTSQAGRHLITITATDGGQLSNTKSFYINIMKPVIDRGEFPETPEPIERKFEKPEEKRAELNPHDLPPVMRVSADEGANRQINNQLNRPQMGGRDALPLADDNAGLGYDSWMNAKTSSQLDISGNIRVIDLKVEGREIAVQITDEASDRAELFKGELADGSPLPSWVKVDKNTGLTTADPPPGTQSFEMRVVAEDGGGNSRAIDLVLDPTMIKGESDTGRQIADDKVVNNAATNSTNDATQAIVENTPLSRPTGATGDANPSSSTVDVLNDGRVVFGETSEAAPSGALKLMRMLNEADGVKIEITDDAQESATRYEVRQKDGSAAPDWVQVDIRTGELTIEAPQNIDAIELTIIALDGGEERRLDVDVDLEETRLQPLSDTQGDTQDDLDGDDDQTGDSPNDELSSDDALPVSGFVPLDTQIDKALSENSYGRDIQQAAQSLN